MILTDTITGKIIKIYTECVITSSVNCNKWLLPNLTINNSWDYINLPKDISAFCDNKTESIIILQDRLQMTELSGIFFHEWRHLWKFAVYHDIMCQHSSFLLSLDRQNDVGCLLEWLSPAEIDARVFEFSKGTIHDLRYLRKQETWYRYLESRQMTKILEWYHHEVPKLSRWFSSQGVSFESFLIENWDKAFISPS